ncbi:MAG: BrnA antitoxin family protein [Rhodothermales bacterium]
MTGYKDAYAICPVAKERITIRIDRDVLDYFRKQGKGYQSRMNAVQRAFMNAETRNEE